MHTRKARRKLLLISKLLAITAVVVLVSGLVVSWRQREENAGPQRPAAPHTEQAPSAKKPTVDEFKNHQTAPDEPRYLFIPKISVRAMVKRVGATPANQIESPRNVFDVGWYNKSSKPGKPGAVVMDGHVSSWEANGVFYKLKNLKPADEIIIERGDGTALTYRVVKSQTYDSDNVDMAAALSPISPDKPGLNLISCTGKVIKDTNEFDKRIVVFAEQI